MKSGVAMNTPVTCFTALISIAEEEQVKMLIKRIFSSFTLINTHHSVKSWKAIYVAKAQI